MMVELVGFNRDYSSARFAVLFPDLGPDTLHTNPAPWNAITNYQYPDYFLGSCMVDIGYFEARSRLGYGLDSTSSSPESPFPRMKPEFRAYDPLVDRDRYSSRFGNLVDFLNGSLLIEGNQPGPGRPENGVVHASSRGKVRSLDYPLFYPTSEVVAYAFQDGEAQIPVILADHPTLMPTYSAVGNDVGGVFEWTVSPLELISRRSFFLSDLLDTFAELQRPDGSWKGSIFSHFGQTHNSSGGFPLYGYASDPDGDNILDNFEGTYDFRVTYKDGLPITFSVRNVKGNGTYMRAMRTFYRLTYTHIPYASSPPRDDGYPTSFIELFVERRTEYQFFLWTEYFDPSEYPPSPEFLGWSCAYPGQDDNWFVTYTTGSSSDVLLTSHPSPAGSSQLSPLLGLARSSSGAPLGIRDRLRDHRLSVLNDAGNIRPSSFRAVSNAIGNYVDLIKTNHIETIAEFQEIFSLLPEASKLAVAYSSLRSGDYAGGSLAIGDFISGTYLKKKFGIDPLLSNVQEAIGQAEAVKARLRDLYSSRTLYGEYKYVFPEGTFGYKKSTLITRAKVRINFDESSLLSCILGPRAVGLFPKLSSWWDIVQLSFVIDWFTKFGTRLGLVDEQIMLYAFRISWCVYSYTIYSDLDDELLESFNLSSVQSHAKDPKPAIKFYAREFSRVTPILLNSRFDFEQPRAGPDAGIAGSLAWQILRR